MGATKSESKALKITLLTAERNKNMELILGKLRMSNALIVESLWSMNEDVLLPGIVESLLNAIPQETERTLWAPEIDKSTLAVTDLFCLEMAQVSDFESRLRIRNI